MSKFEETGVILRERQSVRLTTLAADTVLLLSAMAMTSGFRMLKSKVRAIIQGLTAGEGTGLILGLASSDLTTGQIQECLHTNGPLFRGDRDKKEEANRPVWLVGQVEQVDPASVDGNFVNENGGPEMIVKPQWTFPQGAPFIWFVYNRGSTMTTGSEMSLTATSYGVWVGT